VLQQHVDHKIANALLKKGTRDAYKKWNQQDRAWVSHGHALARVALATRADLASPTWQHHHKECGIIHNQ
jgi:hypothetical protein